MKAKTIQICGTGSGVGKSVIVAGLCRIFLQDGFKVAPFKAQNMALNSAVTQDNLEIGRAQAMQAEACKIEPTADMNPILLKPTSDVGAQVIVRGKPLKNMSVLEYKKYKSRALKIVKSSLDRLTAQYDIVVIEGAGSPAEINLKSHDIVNMKIALFAKSSVILVGDIDRGGVFAWLVGTMELLEKREKELVKAFIINKFRGDKRLLDSGLKFLEKRTNKKVLGVIPYFKDIRLPEEDSLFFNKRKESRNNKKIEIAVIALPHISNFTDFDCFQQEGVSLRYVSGPEEIGSPDAIIIPGTKNTASDLKFLHTAGLADKIKGKARQGIFIIGICGGYQMLGKRILDKLQVESKGDGKSLGLLNIETIFKRKKETFRIEGIEPTTGCPIKGYEIHHGTTKRVKETPPMFLIKKRGATTVKIKDGAQAKNGRIWGTYIHGVFDNPSFRKNFINRLRVNKGLKPIEGKAPPFDIDKEYDKLAHLLRKNLNMDYIYKVLK